MLDGATGVLPRSSLRGTWVDPVQHPVYTYKATLCETPLLALCDLGGNAEGPRSWEIARKGCALNQILPERGEKDAHRRTRTGPSCTRCFAFMASNGSALLFCSMQQVSTQIYCRPSREALVAQKWIFRYRKHLFEKDPSKPKVQNV